MRKFAVLFKTLCNIHLTGKKSLIIILAIPIIAVFIMLLTGAMRGGSSLVVAFRDEDNTKASESLRDMLASTERVIFAQNGATERSSLCITVPEGFEQSLLDRSGMKVTIAGDNELAMGEYIRSLLEYRIDNMAKLAWLSKGDKNMFYSLLSEMPQRIDKVLVPDIHHKEEINALFLALLNIFIMLGSVVISAVLIEDSKRGILRRLNTMGTGAGKTILALSFIFLIAAAAQAAVTALFTLALDASGAVSVSVTAVIFAVLVSNIFGIFLGVFAGSAARNLQTAIFIVALAVLPLSMISGGLFPLTFSSGFANDIISLFPARYVLDPAGAVAEGPFGGVLLLKGFVLLAAGAVLMFLSGRILRRKIQNA